MEKKKKFDNGSFQIFSCFFFLFFFIHLLLLIYIILFFFSNRFIPQTVKGHCPAGDFAGFPKLR